MAPRFALISLAIIVTSAVAHGQNIAVQLLFDGSPLQTAATPGITCKDEDRDEWFDCAITPDSGTARYVMKRPAPGHYTIHVEVYENKDSPARFPGDYDVFHHFVVTDDGPLELDVDVLKLIHVTLPWDNTKDLYGMLLRPRAEKPVVGTTVTFQWDPLVPAAEYGYEVYPAHSNPYTRLNIVVSGTTSNTSVTLHLPLSAPEQYYEFWLTALRAGHQIGEVFTYDSCAQGQVYRFVVGETPRPPEQPKTAAVANTEAFLAEWKAAIPRPAWWGSVPDLPMKIDSLGDLQVVWEAHLYETERKRQFFKAVYQAIVNHPDDEDLVTLGIQLMGHVETDYQFRLHRFYLDHFFYFNRRTDNCASNCKAGELTGEIVRELAYDYIWKGEPQTAIELIQRLVQEREKDVSAYNLALTFEALSRAYWKMGDAEAAKAAIREGLRRFPKGWQADELRETLSQYEQDAFQPGKMP